MDVGVVVLAVGLMVVIVGMEVNVKCLLVRVCYKGMRIRNWGIKGMLMTACSAINKLNTKVMR